jgi:3-oxoacyl-[acyl-carrier protein] reductase
MSTNTHEENRSNKTRVAIVTGASRGIGAEVAGRLAADGLTVIVNYAGQASDAQAVVSRIESEGGRAFAVQADVQAPEQVARLFDTVDRTCGGVDVVVNNAGVMALAPLVDTDDATFDRMVAVNFKGTFNTLREGARRIRSGGRIINFSSAVIGRQLPTYAVYAATKAAVEAMTVILAKELRGRNVTVNAVAPGPIATELYLRGKPPEVIEQAANATPLERLGQPVDVARVVSFLAGPDGGWVNGQTLRVNGGLV